jgi:hypothetical protein
MTYRCIFIITIDKSLKLPVSPLQTISGEKKKEKTYGYDHNAYRATLEENDTMM